MDNNPKGNLFIIGGGRRLPQLMQQMLQTAGVSGTDYIVVLPMETAETDSAADYFARSLPTINRSQVVNFNLNQGKIAPTSRLDSWCGQN